MQHENPFEKIYSKLDQFERTLIHLLNRPPTPPKEIDPNRIIDLEEVAKLLKKPVGTVRRYIHTRNLPATMVGKGYRIKYVEFIKWYENFPQIKNNDTDAAKSQMILLRNKKRGT